MCIRDREPSCVTVPHFTLLIPPFRSQYLLREKSIVISQYYFLFTRFIQLSFNVNECLFNLCYLHEAYSRKQRGIRKVSLHEFHDNVCVCNDGCNNRIRQGWTCIVTPSNCKIAQTFSSNLVQFTYSGKQPTVSDLRYRTTAYRSDFEGFVENL